MGNGVGTLVGWSRSPLGPQGVGCDRFPILYISDHIYVLIAGQPPGGSRLADLLLPRRAARLDRWSVLLIANVDDAPRDASSAREVKDLRVAAGNANAVELISVSSSP